MARDASGDLVVSYSTVSAYCVSAALIYWSKRKKTENLYSFKWAWGWWQSVHSFDKSDLCRQGFMLPDCSGTPTWGVGQMDMENLIAACQGYLENCLVFWSCSRGWPWPWGWLPSEPPYEISEISNQSLSCSQCHPLLSPLRDHPGICLGLSRQVWLYQEKGLNWVMSALLSAGLVLPI